MESREIFLCNDPMTMRKVQEHVDRQAETIERLQGELKCPECNGTGLTGDTSGKSAEPHGCEACGMSGSVAQAYRILKAKK